MTQHTPGPWDASSFQEGDLAQAYYVTNNDGRRICLIAGYGERKRYRSPKSDDALNAEDVANARLIAAAPEMAVALQTLIDLYDAYFHDDEVCNADIVESYAAARQLLGKATGENLQKSP